MCIYAYMEMSICLFIPLIYVTSRSYPPTMQCNLCKCVHIETLRPVILKTRYMSIYLSMHLSIDLSIHLYTIYIKTRLSINQQYHVHHILRPRKSSSE